MSQQLENNDYPSSTEYFGVPTEPSKRKHARRSEKGKTLAEMPMLKATIKRLDERIKFYNSLDSIELEQRNTPEDFMHQVEANKLTVVNLTEEKNYLEGLIENTD